MNLTSPGPNPAPVIKKRRSPWLYLVWFLVIAVVGIVAWIGVSGVVALKNITVKNANATPANLSGSRSSSQVLSEGDSRINILLAGIAGIASHGGSNLTDTLEVYSIDPVNKTVDLLSIPRDLYIALPDGSHGRINVVNTLGAAYCKKHSCPTGVDQGGAAMEGVIGDLLGIKINYFVRINFQGFQQVVDNISGIDVTVPTTLYDPLYPCPDPSTAYCPINIKAGLHHFDGATALEYARSRETTSDFARAARQQQTIAAIRMKTLSLGVLANPAKVTQLINVLGKNLKTDIQPSDYSALLSLVRQSTDSATTVIDTSATGPLTSGVIGGADVLLPKAGPNNFTGVQAFVAGALKDPHVVKEAATVNVVNASGKTSQGATVAEQLKNLGYNVIAVTTAPTLQTATTVTNNSKKPYSSSLLQKRFLASFATATSTDTADITVTIGSKYVSK